jgi:hypothetical protein
MASSLPWANVAGMSPGLLPLFVSMKKGRVSSGGEWSLVRVLVPVGGLEQCSCLYGLLAGGSGGIGASAPGRKSQRAVRPPDEKRRLAERTLLCEKACARSRG